MSLFDFPRINITGIVQLNPPTANNDDFAGSAVLPANWGPFAGAPLGLMDSKLVQAQTYGMSDENFIAWVQQAQTFNSLPLQSPPQTQQQFPAEWNYYGDSSSQVLSASVVGVTTAPGQVYSKPDAAVPLSGIIGSSLTFAGSICDVNSEGSPPATQFFIEQLTLKNGSATAIQGPASKGACQWLNFYRNVNLTTDAGAGGYVYHVIRKGPGTVIDLPGFESPDIVGVIFRYYLFNIAIAPLTNDEMTALYARQGINPGKLQFVATIAPLYKDEAIVTGPTGRLLVFNGAPNIPPPAGLQPGSNNGPNNNNYLALAPAVLQQTGSILSADFSGTFPDYSQTTPGGTINPKFDFGPVNLIADGDGISATIASIDYTDTEAGNQRGWLFDFDLSANADAQRALGDPHATFRLASPVLRDLLQESEYYFVSNQQAIYTEQFGSGENFVNQGTAEPATVSVYHRGRLLTRENCPPITLWQYRSIPLQAPGNAVVLSTSFKPGDPIVVDTSQPGDYLFTFTINDPGNPPPAGYPPQNCSNFLSPPYLTNWTSISLRILPNNEDFSRYVYVDPSTGEAIGNELLTFEFLYAHVLRTYHVLYPAMSKYVQLNSESAVAAAAARILQVTDPSMWMSIHYMPRTRDLSASRRMLLQAWCRKVLARQGG